MSIPHLLSIQCHVFQADIYSRNIRMDTVNQKWGNLLWNHDTYCRQQHASCIWFFTKNCEYENFRRSHFQSLYQSSEMHSVRGNLLNSIVSEVHTSIHYLQITSKTRRQSVFDALANLNISQNWPRFVSPLMIQAVIGSSENHCQKPWWKTKPKLMAPTKLTTNIWEIE